MVRPDYLPEYVNRLPATEDFSFACHSKVECFTECCRMLELALTPYDVLRLRKATNLHSEEILDKYIIIEHDIEEPFPRFYLTMVDDGRASCVFVSPEGCTIYPHRPAACRAYPLGRAAIRTEKNEIKEHFVIMKEKHCSGFHQPTRQNALQYCQEQGLAVYNAYNDAVAQILQHESIRRGFIPSKEQTDLFTLALYNIDTFRDLLFKNTFDSTRISEEDALNFVDDEKLLQFSVNWLHQQLFTAFK